MRLACDQGALPHPALVHGSLHRHGDSLTACPVCLVLRWLEFCRGARQCPPGSCALHFTLEQIQLSLPARRLNFPAGSQLALAGTIQFAASLQLARAQLADAFPALAVPQAKPLSPGAPPLPGVPLSRARAASGSGAPGRCCRWPRCRSIGHASKGPRAHARRLSRASAALGRDALALAIVRH